METRLRSSVLREGLATGTVGLHQSFPRRLLPAGWLALGLAVLPMITGSSYHLHLAVLVFVNILLASSLRLFMLSGLVSFAHAAFFAIGGITSALLVMRVGLTFWIAMPLGGVAAGLAALLLGLPTLRLRGVYFFLVTFAFGEILRLIASRWDSVTGGQRGLSGIPRPQGIDSLQRYYWFGVVLVVVVFAVMCVVDRSRTGSILRSIDQQADLSESVGINTSGYRMAAFVVSCSLAGMTGAFYVHFIQTIGPTAWDFHRSIEVLAFVIIGGVGSIWGPVVGATLLTLSVEVFHTFEDYAVAAYGALMVVVVVGFPQGIVGLVVDARNAIARRFRPPGGADGEAEPTVEKVGVR